MKAKHRFTLDAIIGWEAPPGVTMHLDFFPGSETPQFQVTMICDIYESLIVQGRIYEDTPILDVVPRLDFMARELAGRCQSAKRAAMIRPGRN